MDLFNGFSLQLAASYVASNLKVTETVNLVTRVFGRVFQRNNSVLIDKVTKEDQALLLPAVKCLLSFVGFKFCLWFCLPKSSKIIINF